MTQTSWRLFRNYRLALDAAAKVGIVGFVYTRLMGGARVSH